MSDSSKTNTLYYIHCLIGVTFMFGFGYLPPISTITPLGMQMLGIFLGIIYMWSFVDTLWPSVLGLFALAFSDYGTAASVAQASFGNSTSVMLLMFLTVVGVIEQSNLAEYLSNEFLSIKRFNNRPWLFTTCWFAMIALMTSCCNMFLVAFTFWAVFYKFCELTGIKKGSPYASLMIIGTLIFAALGQIILPYNGIALIANSAYMNMGRPGVVYMFYIPTIICFIALAIVVYVGMMRYIFKADVSTLAHLDMESLATQKQAMTKEQKVVVVFLLVLLVALLLPGLVPATTWIGAKLAKLSAVGIMWLGFSVLCFLKLDGKPILVFSKIVSSIPWNLYFIITAAMAISTAITANGTGVKECVLQILGPITASLSPWAFIALLTIVAVVLTNIANNIVVCLVLISVLAMYASQFPVNEPVALTLIMVGSCFGYMLPSSSVTGALMHGNDWLTPKEIYKYIFVIVILLTLCLMVVGIPLGLFFYA